MSSEHKDDAPATIPSETAHLFGAHLPEGSPLFQEVMSELSPRPKTPEPIPRVRKVSKQEKHVHIVTDVDKNEVKVKDKTHDHQIMHGMCHCYFVHNGGVKGIADHSCHHQHKKQGSPGSSPRMARKNAAGATPEDSPKNQRKVTNHHHHHHHHSTLMAEEFRSRAHSDTTAALAQRVKKTSLANASHHPAASTGARASPTSHTRHHVPSIRKEPASPDKSNPSSPVRRVSSFRQSHSTSTTASPSPSHSRPSTGTSPTRRRSTTNAPPLSSSPPPVRVQRPSIAAEIDYLYDVQVELPPGRKISTHVTPSEELHFLYDQFLRPSPDTTSGSGRQRSHTIGAVP